MAQFQVYRNTNPATESFAPYLLDLQHGLLNKLNTRVVAPLLDGGEVRPITRLNPSFTIEGRELVMSTQELAGVPDSILGEPVASLADQREEIIGALDLLFIGV